MSGSTRVKGAALGFILAGQNHWADATSVVLDNEEASSDVTTFADAAAGGARQPFFTVSAIQSTATGSFWRYVYDNTGAEVAFIYAPHGNQIATAEQPHFTGTLKIGPKPPIGGAAGQNVSQTFETRFDVTAGPVLDLGTTGGPVITVIDPDTASVGDQVQIHGTRFTGATAVNIDGLTTGFVLVGDSIIVATIPAGAELEAPVTVTTPQGTSPAVEITVE